MSRLHLDRLVVSRGGLPLVRDLDLELSGGQIWALLGRNGAGKSSLLHALAGLLPYSGRLLAGHQDLARLPAADRARRVGLLLQDPETALSVNVREAVTAGRFPWHGPWRGPGGEDQAAVDAALAALKLEPLAGRPLTRLSGGERRRVQLACLLAQAPEVWLLDEPMNHLDWRWQLETECLLTGEARRERIVILALHDLNLAERLCSHALLLEGDGRWCAGPLTEVLTEARASALYDLPLVRETTALGAYWHPGRTRSASW